MTDLWHRLKQRKLVQWAVAYVAAAFALLQGIDIVAQQFGWPESVRRGITLALVLGFFVTLILAWYHGERGEQKVTSIELLILAAVLAVGGGLLWRYAQTTTPAAVTKVALAPLPPAKIPAKSVAVLPFANLSADPSNAFFADGIQDEILTGLARIGDLKVISRTSTRRYASRPDNVKQIATELGVATILEGSVQKAGNQVLINVQLIDASTDNHIWAQSYKRTLDDIFGVEGEVAQNIAASLQVVITKEERSALDAKPTSNPNAYTAYLRGRALLSRSTFDQGNVEQIIGAFQEAVTLDPGFALAWAGLVQQEVWMYWEGFDPTPARLAAAKAALDRAVALAPHAPEMELARAWYLYYGARDFRAALQAFRAAQRGLPNDAAAWDGAAAVERRLGQFAAAVADIERARALDPNDVSLTIFLGQMLLAQRKFAQANAAIAAGLVLDAKDPDLLQLKLFVLWSTGDLDGADRVLASQHADRAATLADRATQALYRRDYAIASGFYQRAVATAGNFMTPASFGGYIPAVDDWRLDWAMSEDRRGAHAHAIAIYVDVKTHMLAALANEPGNIHVQVALRMVLAEALAGLGEHDAAATQGRKAVALMPESMDAWEGSRWSQYLARIYATNGDVGNAAPLLQHLLSVPGARPLTPASLRLDPVWDPIRKDPRFRALLEQFGNARALHATGNAGS